MNLMRQALQATSQGRIQSILRSRTNCITSVNQKLRAYVSAVIWDARVRRRSWPYVRMRLRMGEVFNICFHSKRTASRSRSRSRWRRSSRRRRGSISFGCNSVRSPSATASAAPPAPMEVVLLRFSPKDFKDADLEHIKLETFPHIERTEYVSNPPLTYMMLVTTGVENVAAFIGATIFLDCLQVKKEGMKYRTTAWEHECWHWNAYLGVMALEWGKEHKRWLWKGKELKRDKKIKNIKPVTYIRQDCEVFIGKVLTLRRDAKHVQRFGDEFVVKYMDASPSARTLPQ